MNVSFLVVDECFGSPEDFKYTNIPEMHVARYWGTGQMLAGLCRGIKQCSHSWYH